MSDLFIKYRKNIIGGIVGGISGYLYWTFIGCNSGSCPITSNPFSSVLFGVVFGYLFSDLLKKASK